MDENYQSKFTGLIKSYYQYEKFNIEIDCISKKIGIERNDFLNIFNSPLKSYKDYPNDEKKLEFIYGIYSKFFPKIL